MIGGKLDFKKEMFDRKNCVNVGKRKMKSMFSPRTHILNSAQSVSTGTCGRLEAYLAKTTLLPHFSLTSMPLINGQWPGPVIVCHLLEVCAAVHGNSL